jgi:hypothetical protein
MSLVETRRSLHLLAERVISPLRVQETGNEIALQPRPGGFGTPELPGGGWVGVSGTSVVRVGADGVQHSTPITTLPVAAAFVGLSAPVEDAALRVDAAAAARLAEVWAIGHVALVRLVEVARGAEPIHLWPEHFDIATVLAEVNYGVSPGDDDHDEPYAYVAPWQAEDDPRFNAVGFRGAEAPVADAEQVFALFRTFGEASARA